MINSSRPDFFTIKTHRQSSKNKFAHFLVVRTVFSCFYIFHKEIVIFFVKFSKLRGERNAERRRILPARKIGKNKRFLIYFTYQDMQRT
jgi:hypothetical protein